MREDTSVVLIDDDAIFNFLNTKVVKSAGEVKELKVFTKASDALFYLQSLQVSQKSDDCYIIFLDINIPDIDGWEFLELFVQMPVEFIKFFSVYILSSSSDPDDVRRSQDYSVVKGFISKPLTIAHVRSIIS